MKQAKRTNVPFWKKYSTVITLLVGMVSVLVIDRTLPMVFASQSKNNAPAASAGYAVPACANSTNGLLRTVKPGETCKDNEESLELQRAIKNLVSDVEVVWSKAPGNVNTTFPNGATTLCPEGKVAIAGGSTQVLKGSAPFGPDIQGDSGTGVTAKGWWVDMWRWSDAPIVYTVCAKVN